MESSLAARIVEFIADEAGASVDDVTPETRLLHDLRLWGEDAEDFLVAFGHRFGVQWTGFDFARYFYPEATLFHTAGLIQHLRGLGRSTLPPLTVSMLLAAAEAGEWRGAAAAGQGVATGSHPE